MSKAPTEEAMSDNVQAYNTHSDDNNFATYDACNISHEFIVNFNMNRIQCTLLGLLNMLKTVEPKGMGNFWPLIPLRKVRGNPKGPFRKDPRPNILKTVNVDKDKSKSNDPCFHCEKQKGHYKRNCKA
ncbi:zinc finger protein [Abeliophyllum distichum]|uniref:Zinc finger protein n=1 Tax=Abeliophyllum distichum TaxID=126358 RepID=A0ABD1TE52_9LAMI